MLEDVLDNYLEAMVSPEKYALYSTIIGFLEGIERDTIQDELIGIINSTVGDEEDSTHKPDNAICDEIHSHLHSELHDGLIAMGIQVVHGISLNDVFELYSGMAHIGSSEDTDGIMAIVSGDDDNVGKLAEILNLITSIATCHWEVLLEEVAPELIKKISGNAEFVITHGYDALEINEGYLAKLRIYAEFIQQRDQQLLMFSMIDSVILGSTFETYINSGLLHDLFDGNEMPKLAMELYGMALMSSDARQDPVNSVRNIIEKYLNDTNRIVKLNAEIGQLSAHFVKFYQLAAASSRN